jgi:hypothetical protein
MGFFYQENGRAVKKYNVKFLAISVTIFAAELGAELGAVLN